MQNGQFITERLMPEMIREICKKQGISYTSFSGDWLLHMEKNGKVARVLGYKFSLNDSVASSIAQDKVASYKLLKHYELPAVPHYLIRTKANEAVWRTLPWSRGMVIKPLVGTSGHGVAKFFSADDAEVWMGKWGIEAWAASPLIEIKREIRLILLDGEVLLSYEKQPVEIDGLKFFNLGKGATAIDHAAANFEVRLAEKARAALGLRLCAVDIIERVDKVWQVLEVNDGIMMENYARQTARYGQDSKLIYEAIIKVLLS